MHAPSPDGSQVPEIGAPDPLHEELDGSGTWTRVNIGEAIPGVPTPLTWTWCGPAWDESLRRAWVRMGVFPRRITRTPSSAGDRFVTIGYGRPVLSVDLMREIGDRMPGNSGDAVEQGLFGTTRPEATNRPTRRRYAAIAALLPGSLLRSRRALRRLERPCREWWQSSLSAGGLGDEAAARAVLVASRERFVELTALQCIVTIGAQACYEQLTKLCASAGLPGSERALTTTAEGTEELRMATELSDVARGTRTMESFLAAHGHHGPVQGELSVPSWRMDPTPVVRIVESLKDGERLSRADTTGAGRSQARRVAHDALIGALGPVGRVRARILIRLADDFMILRELGRSLMLMATDVARAAAWALGDHLAGRGALANQADVMYLRLEELLADRPVDRSVIEERRSRRAHYERHDVPDIFTGAPPLLDSVSGDGGDGCGPVTGIGASPGVVEGRVRVVTDVDSCWVEEGEILVCETTNPSWASLFLLAAGVVIDVGGVLSHGAIVAREMGIPCVINTVDGTRRLHTGDLVRVDGSTGSVEVIEPATASRSGRE
ncbi:MAG: PEP-utilizing enzyme [Acidimicrobiia bacterium]|nr:PEP-utilizing enzyme [Acidimicrobiia bacterium]